MKTILTILCVFTTCFFSAQSIDRQILASAGNTFETSSNKLTFTIGEPIIGVISNTVTISQGFLATASSGVTLSEEDVTLKEAIKLYPNPVTENLSINLKNTSGTVILNIYSISGKLVLKASLNGSKNLLNLSHLSNGTYLVNLEFTDYKNTKTFKIIKK